MTDTAADHLLTVIRHWPDLQAALGTPNTTTWPPAGLRSYLADLDQVDAEEAAALRALERDPIQLGARPVPIRVTVHDTMRTVEAALVHVADVIAADVQRSPMPPSPRWWPAADRARRDQLATQDAADPRRWRYVGTRTAPTAAAWLYARIQGRPGPFRPLTATHHQHIDRVAAGAATRVERALELERRTTTVDRPCPDCHAPALTVHGGDGTPPTVRCDHCGRTWTAADAA